MQKPASACFLPHLTYLSSAKPAEICSLIFVCRVNKIWIKIKTQLFQEREYLRDFLDKWWCSRKVTIHSIRAFYLWTTLQSLISGLSRQLCVPLMVTSILRSLLSLAARLCALKNVGWKKHFLLLGRNSLSKAVIKNILSLVTIKFRSFLAIKFFSKSAFNWWELAWPESQSFEKLTIVTKLWLRNKWKISFF